MSNSLNHKNLVSKEYLSDPGRFAQICNNELFNGEQLICPEKLRELDTGEMKTLGLVREELESFWKERDILKIYDDQMILSIIGIENQSDIHYCMPLRNMLYDALDYERQRAEIGRRHRRMRDLKGAEYISGFARTDRLIPVFTLTIYWGEKEWDAAKCLHELLDIPPELAPYKDRIADYRLNFLDVHSLDHLERYSGELKALLGFVKFRRHKRELAGFVEANREIFRAISPESAQAIAVLGDAGELEKHIKQVKEEQEKQEQEEPKQEEEEINMCQALQEMMDDAREEGREEMRSAISEMMEDAREEGREEMRSAISEMMDDAREEAREEMRSAISEMMEDAREEGREEVHFSQIKKKLSKGKTIEEIADALEENVAVIQALIKKMNGQERECF